MIQNAKLIDLIFDEKKKFAEATKSQNILTERESKIKIEVLKKESVPQDDKALIQLLQVKLADANRRSGAAEARVEDWKAQSSKWEKATESARKLAEGRTEEANKFNGEAIGLRLGVGHLRDQNTDLKKDKAVLQVKLDKSNGQKKYYLLTGFAGGFGACTYANGGFSRN